MAISRSFKAKDNWTFPDKVRNLVEPYMERKLSIMPFSEFDVEVAGRKRPIRAGVAWRAMYEFPSGVVMLTRVDHFKRQEKTVDSTYGVEIYGTQFIESEQGRLVTESLDALIKQEAVGTIYVRDTEDVISGKIRTL
jgi:hypothetical protein